MIVRDVREWRAMGGDDLISQMLGRLRLER